MMDMVDGDLSPPDDYLAGEGGNDCVSCGHVPFCWTDAPHQSCRRTIRGFLVPAIHFLPPRAWVRCVLSFDMKSATCFFCFDVVSILM